MTNAKQLIEQVCEQASLTEDDWWPRLIAYANALYEIAWTFHWRSKGSNYYGDHELYARLYIAARDDIDGIAEKAIGTTDDDSFIHARRWARDTARIVDSLVEDDFTAHNFPAILLAAERGFLDLVSDMKEAFETQGILTDGVDDFLQAAANKHEGHVYLLQQRARD